MKSIEIKDTTKINDYKEVDKVELSTITKNDGDKEILSGLLLYGYEMKFGKKNENQEVYAPNSLTNYIEKYFVTNKLNIPVTIQHRDDIQHLAGRVLVVEVNSVGFYFVVYVPKTFVNYQILLNNIKEGILQGFSKEGWATDYEYFYAPDGSFDYMLIKEMTFYCLSIVATPANSLAFEKIATTKIENTTTLIVEQKKELSIEDELF
jgi:phage head maturation protease